MILNFNIENLKYIKIDFNNNDYSTKKMALKEKNENNFVTVMPKDESFKVDLPCKISLSIITEDGLYKTNSTLTSYYNEDEYTVFEIENPHSLDYEQNRAYYRTLAEYDCVYTIETDDGIHSYNATTFDISVGGVSIITEENTIPTQETSIIIYTPERSIKSYLKFVRCESYEDQYKLSFIFIDLDEKDVDYITRLCVNKQYKSFE